MLFITGLKFGDKDERITRTFETDINRSQLHQHGKDFEM